MMSRAKAREMRTLREVAWLLLPQMTCPVCGKPLMERKYRDHGHGTPPPVEALITVSHSIGHPNGNNKRARESYPIEKLELVHRSCHKSLELKQRWAAKKGNVNG